MIPEIILELEDDLVNFVRELPKHDPDQHSTLWSGEAKRLWFKVFQTGASMGSPLNDDFLHLLNGTPLPLPAEPPPPPLELARELAEGSPRRAAILILARALIHRSGHPEQLDYTVASLSVQLERHLKT